MGPSDRVARLVESLRALAAREGLSLSEIERRLGWSQGAISKRFKSVESLKLVDVIKILDQIGVDPALHVARGLSDQVDTEQQIVLEHWVRSEARRARDQVSKRIQEKVEGWTEGDEPGGDRSSGL